MIASSMNVNFKISADEDVPNLGSIITLDNKGRLINSQFSKPSSSQNLLKLNHSEEVPDADDLPYAIISYGDTPNVINLPYNDHNYISIQNAKKVENYDKKALDYLSKQSSQSSTRSSFNTNGSVRISHFNSYNSSTSQNDSFYFNDKYKPQQQFNFNQQISHASTPLATKTMPTISHTTNNNNNIFSKNKFIPGAIVINSGSVNKLKGVNVIQLRRPSLDSTKLGETRIINVPINKPSVLTNIIANNQMNDERDSAVTDKTNLTKSINLLPRCICGFTHDDGGMIRCEICRTWQHIVCMYPDNKFPIYYKCERCEPRDIDVKRAVLTQTNILTKTGHNPMNFLVRQEYSDFDLDNDSENNFTKANGSHQFLTIKQDIKTCYRSVSESLPKTPIPIYITASKDGPTVPPGSPRTSKRKQDLISCKSVLPRPNITPKLNVSNVIINNKLEIPKSSATMVEKSCSYTILPTSTNRVSTKVRECAPSPTYFVNPMSARLKAILSTKVHFHTNLSVYNLQYLKQNNFIINTNMYDVVILDMSRYAVKAVVEFNSAEIIMEYNGYVSLTEEYNKDNDFRKICNPYVLFYDKCDRLPICVDSKLVDNKARYVRRSCTPNAEVKHRLLQDGQIRFYVVPINKISKGCEITIAFDYNFMKCRYNVECACNQPSCQLLYLKLGTETQKSTEDMDYERSINIYDCINQGVENMRTAINMTRPYKKRGRGSKTLSTVCRPEPSLDTILVNNVPRTSPLKIVRRNKRGRPPLNRSTGLQRADVVPIIPSQDSPTNNDLSSEYHKQNVSDNDQSVCSDSNENVHPRMTIHTNFKNFKRMSSNHWSLKTKTKIPTITKKPKTLKKLLNSQKVGRPFKVKADEPVISEHDEEYFSDNSHSSRNCKHVKLPYDDDANTYSNEENNRSTSPNSNKADLSREEEGKYWLEEINNKILKQKAKEAKRGQRKSKLNKRRRSYEKPYENKVELLVETVQERSPIKELKEENICTDTVVESLAPVTVNLEENNLQTSKKQKRGRRNQKPNNNYILSYKPSNIDDLKNDLMLISASLEEDKNKDEEDEEVELENDIKEECEVVEETVEQAQPFSKLIENDDSFVVNLEESIGYVEESVEYVNESIEHVEETVEHTDECVEHTEESVGAVDESNDHVDDLSESVEKSMIVDINESELSNNNVSGEGEVPHSKNRKGGSNKASKSDLMASLKASREERWVNTMWQRILKNEHHFDDKSKRKRSKSSAAEGSIASEENRNEVSDIGSPKLATLEISEDRDSSSNSKSSCTQKVKRKTKLGIHECERLEISVKLVDCEIKSDKFNNTFSTTSSTSVDDHQSSDLKESSNEQCGLIVYKEQHSNPMEKFSRENSAKLFTIENVSEGGTTTSQTVAININPPPHTKKRWLCQALMEETLNEEIPDQKGDFEADPDVKEKLCSIDMVSKRSFLPPVFTTTDSIDMSTNTQKVAINPKKRLLNQFSMEGNNTVPTSTDSNTSCHMISPVPVKLSRSEPNADQEQSKTKLTLSEYRKRRFVDNDSKEFLNSGTKYQKNSEEFNNAWVGISVETPKIEKLTNDEFESEEHFYECCFTEDKESIPEKAEFLIQSTSLSYIDTLNNLPMPNLLDPRIATRASTSTEDVVLDLPVIFYQDTVDEIEKESFEPKSPSETNESPMNCKLFRGGPRTPSENGDMSNNAPSPEGSMRSFDSHPSPTSDCHFDFEKDSVSLLENDKLMCTSEPWTYDWTSQTSTIGKMAGIKNPDMLQEIEEFEDEYVPMPENLPERSQEEMETLMLTQKRDSQIREWQEVKQLEREKVKLDHQVRSMARRLHRVNKRLKTPDIVITEKVIRKDALTNYDVKDDEKTMKIFNIQLVNINGRLMEQISMLKNDCGDERTSAVMKSDNTNLPLSYATVEDDINTDQPIKYSKHKKKPLFLKHTSLSNNNSDIYNNQKLLPRTSFPNESSSLHTLSNQISMFNPKSSDTNSSNQKTSQTISCNQNNINPLNQKPIMTTSSNQNSFLIDQQMEKMNSINTTTTAVSIPALLPSDLRPTIA